MPFSAALAAASTRLAEPVPRVDWLSGMYSLGAFPRAGEPTTITGRGGSLKSMFALAVVHSLGIPGVYFSMDQTRLMATKRLAALMTRKLVDQVEKELHDDNLKDYYASVLSGSKISFEFDTSMTIDDMWDCLYAYAEMHDFWPRFIVVDGLTNINTGSGVGDVQGEKTALEELADMAKRTDAWMIIIHHARVSDNAPHHPPALWEIQNRHEKVQRLMLSVAKPTDNGDYKVAVLKDNNSGAGDEHARKFFTLTAFPEYAAFTEQVVRFGQ